MIMEVSCMFFTRTLFGEFFFIYFLIRIWEKSMRFRMLQQCGKIPVCNLSQLNWTVSSTSNLVSGIYKRRIFISSLKGFSREIFLHKKKVQKWKWKKFSNFSIQFSFFCLQYQLITIHCNRFPLHPPSPWRNSACWFF